MEEDAIMFTSSETGLSPDRLAARIPLSSLVYSFYRYPDSGAVIFIYTGPTELSVKHRQAHGRVRRDVLAVAASEGLEIANQVRWAVHCLRRRLPHFYPRC